MMPATREAVREFFAWSDTIDHAVLRPLSHIRANWEASWDHGDQRYRPEEDSFTQELNEAIERIAALNPPAKYHDNEDRLAEFARDNLHWKIKKVGGRWVGENGERWGIDSYASVLEQGAFDDHDIPNLLLAASGRVHAAIARGQLHFDDMEGFHQQMLAAVLSIIIYHRESGTW